MCPVAQDLTDRGSYVTFLRTVPMHSVNVRQLKNNPSEALRSAAEAPVLVLKGNHPEALLLHLDLEQLPDKPDVLLALGAALFQGGSISLGRAARLARVSVVEMISHLSRLGAAVVQGDGADAKADLETLEAWLASS